ncbi:hypothetical protein [Pseudorhodoplanes sinuspersici]|nr:hypothetical protein [Pseudorhodoplanes sinuspersici]RKE67424.1 hypothetical protein DFP91_5188 [Pseudorhodoplanes sinuspersici]
MKILKYTFEVEINDEIFRDLVKPLVERLEATAVSLFLSENLSTKLATPFVYRPTVPSSGLWSLYGKTATAAEVICNEDNILILQNSRAGGRVRGLFGGLEPEKSSFEATAISRTLIDANHVLSLVSDAVYSSLSKAPPSDEIVNPDSFFFIKESCKTHAAYLRRLKDTSEYKMPSYDDEDLKLSKLLCKKEVQEFIFRIVQSRTLTEANFTQEVSAIDPAESLSNFLLASGFVIREAFVECRQNSQRIARFNSDDVTLDSLMIKCATCGRYYRDERIYSAFVASEKLKNLITSSRWMNVLVTDSLIQSGIPREFIYWNFSFGADEIDIVAFIDTLPWVFELKDREFSVTDAHHFNYRRSVIEPSQAFIVTSRSVSPDAKRVFEEISGRGDVGTILGSSPTLPYPNLIEGLQDLGGVLEKMVDSHFQTKVGAEIKSALGGIDRIISNVVLASVASEQKQRSVGE